MEAPSQGRDGFSESGRKDEGGSRADLSGQRRVEAGLEGLELSWSVEVGGS